jgi:hypothetical protein
MVVFSFPVPSMYLAGVRGVAHLVEYRVDSIQTRSTVWVPTLGY